MVDYACVHKIQINEKKMNYRIDQRFSLLNKKDRYFMISPFNTIGSNFFLVRIFILKNKNMIRLKFSNNIKNMQFQNCDT